MKTNSNIEKTYGDFIGHRATNSEQKYKKPGFFACTGGYLAGGTAACLTTNIPKQIIGSKIIAKMKNINNNFTQDEFSQISKGIDTTLSNTGLSKKGVSILKATKENSNEIFKIITEEQMKFIPKKIKEFFASLAFSQVKNGNNAFYTFKAKKLIMPENNKLISSIFHEIGHAANGNLSKYGKLLQKCYPLAMLALPISIIALSKTKKSPNEKPKGIIDKTTDFIKNNAGKLTFLTFIPMLAEEAKASIKGSNFARKVLDPSLAQKISKSYKLAYLSYLGLAVSSSVGIALGVKIKDLIAKPKPLEKKA